VVRVEALRNVTPSVALHRRQRSWCTAWHATCHNDRHRSSHRRVGAHHHPEVEPTCRAALNAAFALDTNVVAAALQAHHAHNDAATAAIARLRQRGDDLVLPAPALLESFAVLTRLPRPYQLTPEIATSLLSRNFEANSRIVSLDGMATWTVIADLAGRSIGGGNRYYAQNRGVRPRWRRHRVVDVQPRALRALRVAYDDRRRSTFSGLSPKLLKCSRRNVSCSRDGWAMRSP